MANELACLFQISLDELNPFLETVKPRNNVLAPESSSIGKFSSWNIDLRGIETFWRCRSFEKGLAEVIANKLATAAALQRVEENMIFRFIQVLNYDEIINKRQKEVYSYICNQSPIFCINCKQLLVFSGRRYEL